MAGKKTVLIVGGSGFIGTHLALQLRDHFKVFATFYKNPVQIPGVTFMPLDALDRDWTKRIVYTLQPEIIFYLVGKNDVRWAEQNEREAEKHHSAGAITVATVSDIFQPKFIYLSNSFVFDGKKGNYKEKDTLLPSTQLGKCKVNSENFIKGRSLNYLIIRSCPVYGRGNGKNISFLDDLRIRLSRGERIEMSTTQLHTFAPIEGLVLTLVRAAKSGLRNRILHYSGLTKVTYSEFAKAFAKRFQFDPHQIVARSDEKDSLMTGPYDYSLNSTEVSQALKINPLLLEQGFDLFEQSLLAHFHPAHVPAYANKL